MFGDIDLLPESEKTLEDIKTFIDLYQEVIDKLETELKKDEIIKKYMEEIAQGYSEVTKLKKEKIDRINEAAKIESRQFDFDDHLEYLSGCIRDVPAIYYRKKIYSDPDNKNNDASKNNDAPKNPLNIQVPIKAQSQPVQEEKKPLNIQINRPSKKITAQQSQNRITTVSPPAPKQFTFSSPNQSVVISKNNPSKPVVTKSKGSSKLEISFNKK
ncbi:hypothetical protein M9Y10_039473 [Tritrichomonas musculus]|uniref:Inhibitor of growth protein N-terminal histone-binding domain-containing protein n=1 Tax=Tritrichomonas musculus TaxID=1915356 RepID=A0ABR2KC06_9EUKA